MTASSSVAASSTTSASAVVITSFPLNPLTTTFSAPSDCSGIYNSIVYGIDLKTSCMPSGFDPDPTSYFSPGLDCPSGYSTACHDTAGVRSITTVTCCPVHSDISLSCVTSPWALSDVWSTLFCTWVAPSSTVVDITMSSNGVTSTTAVPLTSPEGLNAFGVRMVQQSSDFKTSEPASNTATTTSSTTSTTSSTTTSTSTPTISGLSTGAKVAIGVVVPVVVLIAIAGIFFWFRRRSQRYNAVSTRQLSPVDNKPPALYSSPPLVEMSTPQPELMGDPGLPNYRNPVELPAANTGK